MSDCRQALEDIQHYCSVKKLTVSTAESCTGGLCAFELTRLPGSSCFFWGGLVTYANESKEKCLGVSKALLEAYGAVSFQVAEAMASGVRQQINTDIGLSITGIAGPDGGSEEKPVGTVWLGIATKDGSVFSKKLYLEGSRDHIRADATRSALELLLEYLIKEKAS